MLIKVSIFKMNAEFRQADTRFQKAFEVGLMFVSPDDRYWTHGAVFPFPIREGENLLNRRKFNFGFDIGRTCKHISWKICLQNLDLILETQTQKLELKELVSTFPFLCWMRFDILQRHIRDLNVIIERR